MFQKAKTTNKLTALLLAFVMLLSLLPGMSLTAYAANNLNIVILDELENEDDYEWGYQLYDGDVSIAEGTYVQINIGTWHTDVMKIYMNGEVVYTKPSESLYKDDVYHFTAGKNCKILGGDQNMFDWYTNPNVYITQDASVAVTGVTLNPNTAQTIDVGGSVAFTATVEPSGASDKTVKWSTTGGVTLYSDENCTAGNEIGADATSTLTVYAKGTAAGSATVTATSNADSTKSASCNVTVNKTDPEPTSTVSFTKVTDASQITAENIGTCTAEDAKAWVLANFDDVTAEFNSGAAVAELAFYSNTGELNEVMVFEGMDEEAFLENFDSFYSTDIPINNPQALFGQGDTVYLCTPAAATAYAGLKNTTTVVHFDSKDWYLIEDNSTAINAGTVTLLAKECVGASIFGGSSTYSGSTVEGVVNNYYTNSISTDAKTVVSGNGMFLLTTDQANAIKTANVDVLKCSQATGAESILWWLGSPCDPYNAACVYGDDGSIRNSGEYVERTLGVRPALQLDLSKVEFDAESKTFAFPAAVTSWTNGNVTATLEGTKLTVAKTDGAADGNMTGGNWNPVDSTPEWKTVKGTITEVEIQSGVTSIGNNAFTSCVALTSITIPNGVTSIGGSAFQRCGVLPSITIPGSVSSIGDYAFAYCSSLVTVTFDCGMADATLKVGSDIFESIASNAAFAYGTGITRLFNGTTEITASTSLETFSRKTLTWKALHTHDFTYSVSGATITATCTADDCTLTDSRATLTIVAPTLTVYGGTGSAAATLDGLDAFNAATGLNVDADSIVYWKAKIIEGVYKTDGNEPLAGAPTNAGNYLAKITVSNCIASVGYTIAKADPSYTVPTGLTAVFGNLLSSVLLPDGWSWTNALQSVGNAIVNTFKAIFTPADTDNYNTVEDVDVDVTVNKADIHPTVTLEGWTYGETAKTPVVSGNSGNGKVTYTYAKQGVKGGIPFSDKVPTDAGDYIVKATIAETSNYNGGEATAEFTIAKAKINPTVSISGWTYGQAANAPSVSGNTDNGAVTYTYAKKNNSNFSETVPTGAGNYTVKATIAATANYNGATATADFTIAKADINPTVSISGWTYGQAANAPSVSGNTENGTVTYTYAVKGNNDFSATVPTNAGDYTVKATIVATTNYNGATVTADFTIAKADIAPTVSLEGWAYGATAKTPAVTGNKENGTVTYTYAVYGSDSFSATVPTDAGEYTVKATVAATANYNGGEATDDFKIYKADINPTVTLEGWTYGEEANKPVVTGNLGDGEVTFGYAKQGVKGSLYSEELPTEAGDYVVMATIAETANYKGGEATADFTIAKADATPATVTANKLTCDGKEQALVTVTGEAKGGEMQYTLGEDAETAPEDGWSTDVPSATNTGTYFVWYKVVADDNHNDSTPACVEVTIDPDYTVKEVTGLSGNGEDEWTKGGEDGVVITVKDSGEDNSFDHFTGVKLDGKLLTKDVDYTVKKGSTIVTLLPATLEKLSVGEHTVTVLFDNGEVNTDLTVKAANSGSATSPQTGDNSHMGLWIAIMILSLCALAATLFIGKKKRVFDR